MNLWTEEAVIFDCGGDQLVGVIAHSDKPGSCGVLIVVGGPQYRVGSHRQFVLLARRLASNGYTTLRFDYRGMGDSGGAMRDFQSVDDDISAALDMLGKRCPDLNKVVIWGLCDAASAALLYCRDGRDHRVAGLCLLNPWVRSEETLASTQIKHYYLQRVFSLALWKKFLGGNLNAGASLHELVQKLRLFLRKTSSQSEAEGFQTRMRWAMEYFDGQVLLVLSGQDYTAKEFLECAHSDPVWAGLLERPNVRRYDIVGADHTFSSAAYRLEVEQATLDWLREIPG